MKSFSHSLRFNPLSVGAYSFTIKTGIVFAAIFGLACIILQNCLQHVVALPLPFLSVVETEKRSLDQQIADSLSVMNQRLADVDGLKKSVTEQKTAYDQVTQLVAEV